jgi:hypothetical protein
MTAATGFLRAVSKNREDTGHKPCRSIDLSHPLAAPLCSLGLFFLFLNARLVIEAAFLDL